VAAHGVAKKHKRTKSSPTKDQRVIEMKEDKIREGIHKWQDSL
jgi:hypothetical protein